MTPASLHLHPQKLRNAYRLEQETQLAAMDTALDELRNTLAKQKKTQQDLIAKQAENTTKMTNAQNQSAAAQTEKEHCEERCKNLTAEATIIAAELAKAEEHYTTLVNAKPDATPSAKLTTGVNEPTTTDTANKTTLYAVQQQAKLELQTLQRILTERQTTQAHLQSAIEAEQQQLTELKIRNQAAQNINSTTQHQKEKNIRTQKLQLLETLLLANDYFFKWLSLPKK